MRPLQNLVKQKNVKESIVEKNAMTRNFLDDKNKKKTKNKRKGQKENKKQKKNKKKNNHSKP